MSSTVGAREDGGADTEVSQQPTAGCLGACACQRVKAVREVIEDVLLRGQSPPQNKEQEWVNV